MQRRLYEINRTQQRKEFKPYQLLCLRIYLFRLSLAQRDNKYDKSSQGKKNIVHHDQ